MSKIGYARVSSRAQSLDIQVSALEAAGCSKIFSEKFTGTTAKREQLEAMLEYVREGDVLIITKLDRLARSLTDFLKITTRLEEKDVELKVLDQSIDTTTPEGRMTYQIVGAVAEFENNLRKARQMEGIQAALAKGPDSPFKGRPKSIDDEEVKQLYSELGSKVAVAQRMGISRQSVWRALR